MNFEFSTDSFSFWMTLIIQILSPFSIITLTLFYCCSKKGKILKGGENNNIQGGGSGGGGSSGGSNGAKNSDRNLLLDEVIKTDITQEETEITQEISNENGGGENVGAAGNYYEISPYPFEMFHRGFGGKKKKKHHHKQQQQQHDHPIKTGTKRSRQQRGNRPQPLQQQQPIQRLPPTPQNNEMDSISQTQTTLPRQHPASEVVSKPMSQKEKIPFKEKSLAKPSLDLPLGSDLTQSAVCSTQPSHPPIVNNINIINNSNNDNNTLQTFNNGGDNKNYFNNQK